MINFFRKKVTVCTHSGSFHADEVFACATLSIWALKKGYRLKIVRSRDPEVIAKSDIVVDVGGEYDSQRKRFDHHQSGGAGSRDNGIQYASFGLIWKHYGESICDFSVAESIEERLVMPVDARDNGINLMVPTQFGIYDYRLSNLVNAFNASWDEDQSEQDQRFAQILKIAKQVLEREIVFTRSIVDGNVAVKEALKEQDYPDVLVLDRYTYWEGEAHKSKNTKFVVYKHRNGVDWSIQSVKDNPEDYNTDRANMQKEWWGLRTEDLVRVSGVKDALYCAKRGWFGTAKSKEGALEMAQKSLQISQN